MGKDDNSRKEKFDLAELFLVAADIHRTFVATRLERHHDNGEKFYSASVKVCEGEIVGCASTVEQLERSMDIICILKLDHQLHQTEEIISMISYTKLFHN